MMASKTRKCVVIGAGPVGALAALYAAHRGYEVEVYDLRSGRYHDLTANIPYAKSIDIRSSRR